MRSRPIVTERLEIRDPRRADGPGVAAALDETVAATMGWTPNIAPAYVRAVGRRRARGQIWTICDRSTGAVHGLLTVALQAEGRPLGLMLGPASRGRGIGREVLCAFLPTLRDMGLPFALLETGVDNVAMRRAAEAAGFRNVGSSERALPNGAVVTSVRYVHEW